jgi:putative aldouronate transport system substrate-binding protein
MKSGLSVFVLCLVLIGGTAWAAGQQEAATGQPVELVHYVMNAGDISGADRVYDLVNEKLMDQIDATVQYVDIPGGEYEQRIQVVINSGERYDVAFTSNWRNNYYVNVGKGAFADLTDLLPRLAPAIWNTQREYIEAARVGGRIYAVLNEQIFARSRPTNLAFQYADAAGIDAQEYSDRALIGNEDLYDLDLEMRLKLDAVTGPNVVFTALGSQIAWDKEFIVPIIDGLVPGAVYGDDSTLKVVNQYETPAFQELMEYARMLVDRGLIRNTDLVRDSEGLRQFKASGEFIQPIMDGGTYKPGGQEEEAVRWEHLYYQVQMTPATLTTSGIVATMLAVNSQSRNVEKAVEYLNAVFSDDSIYMLFHFGVEGTHHVIEDGFLRAIPGAGYTRSMTWSMGSQFQQVPSVGQPADVWERTRELNASARKSPDLGFNFDPTSVVSEIGQTRSVTDEYVAGLLDGTRPVSDYQEMLDKLRAAGSERIIVELQRQLDAWNAAR